MIKYVAGFIVGCFVVFTFWGSLFMFYPEYTLEYKQGVKDALQNNVKGKVSCDLVVHDVREEK